MGNCSGKKIKQKGKWLRILIKEIRINLRWKATTKR